ncbi:J domain-containing protein [uncultured Sphingomonas sp.]|uniref:J domain-containing protein n=1 Tax=uncultured Sphingomonas sp. TaxID=158754 RepID=UPI0035C97B2E
MRFVSDGAGSRKPGEGREKPSPRFHGRVEGTGRGCMEPGCDEPGEFRAPPPEGWASADGPPPFRWFCLDHVRAFNARYNFFSGMSAEEIHAAQRPYAGWERETRAFAGNASERGPRWADFSDPLDAIAARYRREPAPERTDGKPLSGQDRESLRVLGLESTADRQALRKRYSELVRRYHPDRNGGDRSHETALQQVIAAYQQLRQAPAFA